MDQKVYLNLDGMTVNEVFESAIKANVPATDAAVLVSSWIFQNFGKTKRTFNYAQVFDAVDAACTPTFARTFEHEHWIDGESVVQAEATPGEDGFNARFDNIKVDIDNLHADIRTTFDCLAEMRLALRALLDEIRTEINRLNADIFECCQAGGSVLTTPVPPTFAGLLEQNQFIGTAVVNEKQVGMWKTPQGVMMLPQTFAPGFGPDDRRITDSGRLARFAQNERVQQDFGDQQVTKETFIEKYGNELTDDGVLVRQMLRILPDGASYANIGELIADVTERNAAVIRTTSGASEVVATSLGITEATGEIKAAGVDALTTAPADVRIALQRQGFDRIGDLAEATPQKIVEAVQAEGLSFTAGDAAALQATALTLTKIGRIGT